MVRVKCRDAFASSNSRCGVADKLGIDYERVRARRPDQIRSTFVAMKSGPHPIYRETRDSTIAALKAEPKLAPLRRSLDVYYGDSVRDAAMDKLYRCFIRPGGLTMDIGSHVGDRIASFRRLGARVVALEPQPGSTCHWAKAML